MNLPPEDIDAVVSLEFWRKKQQLEKKKCRHTRVWVDRDAGSVECRDCEATVSAFHVLVEMAHSESRWWQRTRSLRNEVSELKAWKPWMKVAKKLESLWRGGTYLPRCPHCRRALHYKDMENTSAVHKEYAEKPLATDLQQKESK